MYTKDDYWNAMPQWMRDGYNKEVIVFQIVQSAMAANLAPSELVSKAGEVLLRRYVELQKDMIDRAMLNPPQIVICKP